MLADLPGYLRRVGLEASPPPTLEGLFSVHRAHAAAIPFENLDILLGRAIRLDLPSLEAKLVGARRGGYCFEQNTLLAAALADLGFRVTPLAARVRLGGRSDGPRTHMLLSVCAEGRDWLCDVGFGGGGPWEPLPLEPSGEIAQGLWRFRVVRDGGERVLQNTGPSGWRDLYAFTLEPQLPSDYAVANHYTSTHPDSSFTQLAVAQRTSATGALALRGGLLQTMAPGAAIVETPAPEGDALLDVLRERFTLDFPPGTRFHPPARAPERPAAESRRPGGSVVHPDPHPPEVFEILRNKTAATRIAVVGASNDPHKFGNIIVRDLAAKGYTVLPVNPREKEIAGLPAYPDLASVPGPVHLVDVVTPPHVTRGILEEAARLGLPAVWLQDGSYDGETIAIAAKAPYKTVYEACIMVEARNFG